MVSRSLGWKKKWYMTGSETRQGPGLKGFFFFGDTVDIKCIASGIQQ